MGDDAAAHEPASWSVTESFARSGDAADVDPPNPALEVAAVARWLGVAPATLRSWHRRYGIGPRGHTVGGRRHYRPDDVARLQLMQEALARGVPTAEAARWALAVPVGSDARSDVAGADPAAPDAQEIRGAARGPTLPLAGHGSGARGLARAVLSMDSTTVRRVLAESVRSVGVVATWDELARPVLVAIARRWASTGVGVELEHLLSECLLRELDRATESAPPVRNPRPVLLACVPDEAHSLPLSALAAGLAERGVGTRLLGAALPADALAAALRRSAPVALVLWAQARPRPVDDLHLELRRRRCAFFTGGPGWVGRPAQGARHLSSLDEAVQALAGAALGRAVTSG